MLKLKLKIGDRTVKDINKIPFIKEMCETTENMYRLGWDERNGGNISYLLYEDEIVKYFNVKEVKRVIPFDFDAKELVGKYFLVTGTGKYFKNVKKDPANNLGLFRIGKDGKSAEVIWGYEDGGRFTSELPAHLMSHISRLKVDSEHRIIMHTHPTNLLAMTYVHELDTKKFTHSLWQMCTECIVVFPDGIEVLPWMLCGTNEIGIATAEKISSSRVVVWGLHGIYGAGKTLDEAFGLIETVEKAAQMYLMIAHLPRVNTITDEQLKIIAKGFGVKYMDGVID